MDENSTATPSVPVVAPAKKKRSLGKRLLFGLATFGFVLAAIAIGGEIALRCFSNMGTRIFYDGRYLPNYSGTIYNPESHRSIPIRINRDGFRDDDHPIEKVPGTLRVALIGDSFIADMAVEEQHRFGNRLQATISDNIGQKVEVLNFGVSGTDLADYLQNYRYFARKYHPDVVVVCFFNGNDFTGRHPNIGDANEPHPYEQYKQEEFPPVRQFLMSHSVLCNWYETFSRTIRDDLRGWIFKNSPEKYYQVMNARFRRKWADYRVFTLPPEPDCVQTWKVIENQLTAFKREVEAEHSTMLLVQIPSAEQATAETWELFTKEGGKVEGKGWSRYAPEMMVMAITNKLGIAYCSLLPEFVTSDMFCYFGRGHLNEFGDQIAGRTVASAIVKERLLPSSATANATTKPVR